MLILTNNRHIKNTLLFLLIATLSNVYSISAHQKDYIIFKGLDVGLFAVFNNILTMLDDFEKKEIAGARVDLHKGLYYQPSIGPNWWHYYFKPIKIGKETKDINYKDIGYYRQNTNCRITRERGFYLINKYIKIQPYVYRLVDSFYDKNLTNAFLIGIHYRGTDKSSEAPRVDYAKVAQAVQNKIKSLNGKTYKIFIATDEQQFIDYIKNRFTNVYYADSARSTDGKPLHYAHNRSPFKQGLECLTDALLLSRCNTVIRTASNVSGAVSMFNPKAEFISLNENMWVGCPGRSQH